MLLLALAVSIDVLWLVASGLRQVDRELRQITEQQVPTVLQVQALLREAQRLAAIAPEAVTAREALTYNALGEQVDQIARRADSILGSLAAAPVLPPAELAALRRRTDALVERLRDLLAVAEHRILLERQRLILRERLQLVARRLQRAGAAAADGAGGGCLSRWQAALSQVVAELLALGDSQVSARADAAAARVEQAGRTLTTEGDCALARRPATLPFDARAMQAEILALGADDGLFTLERERLRLRDELDDRLSSARHHGEVLLVQTERLFAETRARMAAQGRATRELLRRRLLLLTLTPLALLAVTLGVYWYLSRALLRPIRGLCEALRFAATGGMPRFPAAGNDEVGAIIDASRETLQALNTRELVALMGGTIHLSSREGRGATFSVELPAVESRRVTVGPASAVAVTGYLGPRPRLLVVDDVPSNREVIANVLAGLGFQIHQAPEPGTAAVLAARHPPDLVLMDLAMPDWCGYAGAHAVRVATGRPDLPVVVVSATPLSRADARTLGFITALMKPVETRALLKVVGTVLGLEWMPAPEPPSDADHRPPPPGAPSTSAPTGLVEAVSTTSMTDDAILHVPIRIELEAALELADEERLDDLHEWCDALAEGEPDLARFAARARGYLAAGDLAGLRAWLRRWL